MKILLVSPNTLTSPYPVYPLGLDYVAGSLAGDHQVKIADLNVVSKEELAGLIHSFSPEIIGLSCRNIDNTEAGDPLHFISQYRELVAWLRERTGAVLVCGGSGFTIMPERVMKALEVDYGIIGEGERFALLVDALAGGREPADIAGIVTVSRPADPPAPWDGRQRRRLSADEAHVRFYLERGGMLNLQSKRGCAFRCIYCPYPRIEGRKQRLQAPETVAGMARELEAAGAKYFFITDSAFNSDLEHSLAVARAFKTAGVTIPWGAFFAPLAPPADYFAELADAGLTHVEFGTESMAAAMLKTYRKPFGPGDVVAAHRMARREKIHVAHYLLLGGPGESAETVSESLDRLEEFDRTVFFFFIGIRIYPATALYDIALDEGKITDSTDMLTPVYYRPDAIDRSAIEAMVTARAGGRMNWIIGSGGRKGAATIGKLHARGFVGPLWEHLAR